MTLSDEFTAGSTFGSGYARLGMCNCFDSPVHGKYYFPEKAGVSIVANSSRSPKHKGVFITAADTSVGKTTLAAGLVGYLISHGWDVGVMKPIATGAIECQSGRLISQDAEMLVKFAAVRDPWEWINPYSLASAAVPVVAAKVEKTPIILERIQECFHHLSAAHSFIVAEGAGGVMTPLTESLVIMDLIKTLEIPAIVVTRAGRNAINQALMTLQCLKNREIETLGFFINRFPPKPNLSETTCAELIASLSGALHLGTIPELGDTFSQQQLIRTFENSINKDAFEEAFGELGR